MYICMYIQHRRWRIARKRGDFVIVTEEDPGSNPVTMFHFNAVVIDVK
jgi:hypothetical protein